MKPRKVNLFAVLYANGYAKIMNRDEVKTELLASNNYIVKVFHIDREAKISVIRKSTVQ